MGYRNAPGEPGRPLKGAGRTRRFFGSLRREESGQSLVIFGVAMLAIIVIAAAAIDISGWYSKHHQAQVSADSAALAAANCLALQSCKSPTPSGDAGKTATTYASSNGVTIPLTSDITFDTANKNVTVTTSTAAPIAFGGAFGLHPTVSARAVATWAGGVLPLSLFAENQTCSTGTASGNPLGLYLAGNGGGGNTIFGLFANGEYFNSDNSNATTFNGEVHTRCGSGLQTQGGCNGQPLNQNCWTSNSTVNMVSSAQLYPSCFPEPGVASTSPVITGYCQTAPTDPGPACNTYPPDGYWTTSTSAPAADQITTPGVYCIGSVATGPATTFSSACTSVTASSHTVGSIWVNTSATSSMTSSTGYEFVGPCVNITTGSTGTLSGPSGGPLVYGTTSATGTTCTSCNTGTPDVTISAGGEVFGSGIFDPLGTTEFVGQNGQFTGFVEAQNIVQLQNNGIFGNGPTESDEPGGDALTG